MSTTRKNHRHRHILPHAHNRLLATRYRNRKTCCRSARSSIRSLLVTGGVWARKTFGRLLSLP